MTDSPRVKLPVPVLTAGFVHGTPTLLRALGDAIARHKVLASLSVIRSTYQGVKLVTEADAADDARADADAALDDHIRDWTDLAKMAQEVNARDAAIEVLAGMVARLLADATESETPS